MGKFKNSKFYKKLAQIRRPVKEKNPVRKDNTKKVAFLVWLLILGMFFIAFLSVYLSLNTRSALNDTDRTLSNLNKNQNKEDIPINEADEFLSGFVSTYMNIKNNDEYLEERKEELQKYLVKNGTMDGDFSSIYDLGDIKGDRILKSYNLLSYDEKNDIFKYKVEYDSVYEEKKDEEIESEVLVLNIPVVYESGKFNVSAVPYFERMPELTGSIEVESDDIDLDEYTGKERDKIEEFMNSFFEKYATESEDELSYLMENPTSLDGAFELKDLKDINIYKDNESFVVTCIVAFEDELSGIVQNENVKLSIVKDGENYYIENFEHY